MARAGLDWRAQDLADKSGVGYATIARFEAGANISAESLGKITETLEAQGVQFGRKASRSSVSVPDGA
tara:strand:+ start:1479 stop:1682 length:204 start_codon:yes stop_codon:yes gene_type:complete